MGDSRAFLGRGWAYPEQIDRATGRIALALYDEDVKQAIRIILGTSKGERVMRPDFGCGIHDLVFESISTLTAGLIETTVKEALARYEPRIEKVVVTVVTDEAPMGKLLICIDYTLRTANRPDNVVWPFYLQGRS